MTGGSPGQAITDGSTTASATNDTAFRQLPSVGSSISETYTITNSGTAALTIGTVSIWRHERVRLHGHQPAGQLSGRRRQHDVHRSVQPTASGTRKATISFERKRLDDDQSVHVRHQRRGPRRR